MRVIRIVISNHGDREIFLPIVTVGTELAASSGELSQAFARPSQNGWLGKAMRALR